MAGSAGGTLGACGGDGAHGGEGCSGAAAAGAASPHPGCVPLPPSVGKCLHRDPPALVVPPRPRLPRRWAPQAVAGGLPAAPRPAAVWVPRSTGDTGHRCYLGSASLRGARLPAARGGRCRGGCPGRALGAPRSRLGASATAPVPAPASVALRLPSPLIFPAWRRPQRWSPSVRFGSRD